MDVNLIEAIGQLWKLAVVGLLIVIVVVFRSEIRDALKRIKHMQFQRGDTTLLMSQAPPEEEEPEQQAQAIEPATSDRKEALESSEELSDAEPETSRGWLEEMFRASFSNDAQGLDAAYERAQEAESEATEKLRLKLYTYVCVTHRGTLLPSKNSEGWQNEPKTPLTCCL